MPEFQLIMGDSSEDRHWEGVIGTVGRQSRFLVSVKLKLLHDSGEENVKLLFSQSLPKADSLPNAERNNAIIVDKCSVLQKPVRIEQVGILEVLWIVHDVVETSKDDGPLRNDVVVVVDGDVVSGVVWNSWPDESCVPHAFL